MRLLRQFTGAIQSGVIETFTTGGANGGNAGAITLFADKDIVSTGRVAAGTTSAKNGAKVEITSAKGKIDTNGQDIDAISWYGIGGAITLSADKDINVGAVHNEDDKATAGIKDINLTSTNGNITAKWIRSDSLNGVGGEIRLSAGSFVRVIDSTAINGSNYSIFTDSKDDTSTPTDNGFRSAPIWISHSQRVASGTVTPFIIGDASTNGTTGSISDGIVDFQANAINSREIYDGAFDFNDIHVRRPLGIVASIGGTPFTSDSTLGTLSQFLPYFPVLNVTTVQTIGTIITNYASRLTKSEILSLGLGINSVDLDKYYLYLMAAMAVQGINSVDEQAHFVSQVIHETGRFRDSSEIGGSTQPYAPFYGRGLLQITFEPTYKQFGESLKLGNTFVKDPDLVSSVPLLAVLASTWYWASDYKTNVIPEYGWRQPIPNTSPVRYKEIKSFKDIAEDTSIPNNVVSDNIQDKSDRVERITIILNGGAVGLADRKFIFNKIRPAIAN